MKTICIYRFRNTVLKGIIGDITSLNIDAVVNPANSYMYMGGGLAGVLKKIGGEVIEKEALNYAPVPIGKAVVTTAGLLKAKYVIHSPTMEKPGGFTCSEYVYRATYAALEIGCSKGIYSIALPGMGTGVGGLEPSIAVESMIRAIIDFLKINNCLREIIVIDIREDIPNIFCHNLSRIGGVVN